MRASLRGRYRSVCARWGWIFRISWVCSSRTTTRIISARWVRWANASICRFIPPPEIHEGIDRNYGVREKLRTSRRYFEKGKEWELFGMKINTFHIEHDSTDCLGTASIIWTSVLCS